MKLITAPNQLPMKDYGDRTLFLAGGISGCGDWQRDIIEVLKKEDITILNPRREGTIDRKDAKISGEQITWERWHLINAKEILFWFPPSSVCPIALFELGGALERQTDAVRQNIYLGIHPSYDRKLDIEIQIKNISPHVKISKSLDHLALRVKQGIA